MTLDIGAKFTIAAGVTGQGAIDKLGKSIDGVGESVGRMPQLAGLAKAGIAGLGAALAGLSVGAFVGQINQAADAADELGRLSQMTGVSVETLSGWGAVARRNGEDAQGLAEQINELSLRLTEIDNDTEGAGLALKQIGLSYQDLAKMSAEDSFRAVSTALAGVEDSGKKTAAAMAIIGDEGQKFLPIMNAIGAGGGELASVTTEQARAAAEYKDNLASLGVAGEAWTQTIFGGMIPALNDTYRALTDVIGGTGGMTEEAAKLARDGTISDWARTGVKALSYLLDAVAVVVRAFKIVGTTIGADLAIAGEAFTSLGAAAEKALEGDFAGALETVKGGMARVGTISREADADLNRLWSEKTLGAQLRDRMDEIKEINKATAAAGATAKKNLGNFSLIKKEENKDAKKALDEYEKLITRIRTKTEADKLELEGGKKLTEAQKMSLEIMTQLRDGRLKLTDEQKKTVTTYLEELNTVDKRLQQAEAEKQHIAETADENRQAAEAQREKINSIREEVREQQLATEEWGLSSRALEELKRARQLDKAAELERKAAAMDGLDSHSEMVGMWREEAQAIRDLVGEQDKLAQKKLEQRADPVKGFKDGLEEWGEQAADTAGQVKNALTSALDSGADALTEFVMTGKLNFKDFARSVIADIMQIIVKQQIMSALGMGGAAAGGGLGGGLISAIGGFLGFAKGGAFEGGRHLFATGGVVDTATPFRFAQGGKIQNGVMGEAGPEAIMPLERGANGKLGVRASGGGGGDVHIGSIVVQSDGSTSTSGTSGANAAQLGQLIGAKVREVITQEKRPGGMLAAA